MHTCDELQSRIQEVFIWLAETRRGERAGNIYGQTSGEGLPKNAET
jgi:hypothetical protein